MNFSIGSAFSKDSGSAFSEGPGPDPGPLYKVCRFTENEFPKLSNVSSENYFKAYCYI